MTRPRYQGSVLSFTTWNQKFVEASVTMDLTGNYSIAWIETTSKKNKVSRYRVRSATRENKLLEIINYYVNLEEHFHYKNHGK